jgi:hypothetical protein
METIPESLSSTTTTTIEPSLLAHYFEPSHYVAYYNPSTEIHLCFMEMKQSYFVWIDIKEILPTTTTTTTPIPGFTKTLDPRSMIKGVDEEEEEKPQVQPFPSSSSESTTISSHIPEKKPIKSQPYSHHHHHYFPQLQHLVVGVPGFSSSSYNSTESSAIPLLGHDSITDITVNLSRRLGRLLL